MGILSVAAGLAGAELLVTATALPSIVQDLASWQELRQASWIVDGFFVTSIAVMPIAGRAADRYGLVPPLTLALGVFALASLVAGAAPTLAVLIGARLVQGLGRRGDRAAGDVRGQPPVRRPGTRQGPWAWSEARRSWAWPPAPSSAPGSCSIWISPPRSPPRACSGTSDGRPHRAGVALDLLPGRARGRPRRAVRLGRGAAWPSVDRKAVRFDMAGGVALTVAFAAGLLAVTWLGWADAPGGPLGAVVPAAVALAALALGVVVERRAAEPFLPPGLLRDVRLRGAVLVSGLTGYALATALVGGAVFVDRVRYGGPPDQQLVLGSLALAMAVGALASGVVVRRIGGRVVAAVGIVIGAAGLLLVGREDATSATTAGGAGAGRLRAGFRPDRHAVRGRRGRGPRAGTPMASPQAW